MTLSVSLRHQFSGVSLDVSFDAPPGVTVLFGRSGSGKTTVVNAVAGLLRPDQALIRLEGRVLTDTGARQHVAPHRRRIGYVFQDPRLFPHLSVRQNLRYGRWFAPRAKADPFDRIVDLLGIADLLHRRPGALSGGEKSRVALGRALLSEPQLLLMDEPLAALDDQRKAEILPYLERLRDELQVPMLYVTHSAAELARLATTLVLLEQGRVRHAGPVAAMLADPDLAPLLGLREAGAVIGARIAAQEGDGLTRLHTSGGALFLPRVVGELGDALSIRIHAQDVMLARHRPEGLSALNILPATVRLVRMGEGPGALVQLQIGEDLILARITRRSAETMGLVPGTGCFAILKSVAVARGDVGLRAGPDGP